MYCEQILNILILFFTSPRSHRPPLHRISFWSKNIQKIRIKAKRHETSRLLIKFENRTLIYLMWRPSSKGRKPHSIFYIFVTKAQSVITHTYTVSRMFVGGSPAVESMTTHGDFIAQKWLQFKCEHRLRKWLDRWNVNRLFASRHCFAAPILWCRN